MILKNLVQRPKEYVGKRGKLSYSINLRRL
jgi:hypothetical protein